MRLRVVLEAFIANTITVHIIRMVWMCFGALCFTVRSILNFLFSPAHKPSGAVWSLRYDILRCIYLGTDSDSSEDPGRAERYLLEHNDKVDSLMNTIGWEKNCNPQ